MSKNVEKENFIMTTKEEFLKEIEEYSVDELELIYETQKDLYTEEEMSLIKKQLELYEKEEKEKIEKMLPKEINCSKCEGPNSFENETCVFCGAKLDKKKYYSLEYYENQDADIEIETGGESNTFRYVISFLIPLIGYILGAILLSKDSDEEKSVGQNCIILGIVSAVIAVVVWFIAVDSLF